MRLSSLLSTASLLLFLLASVSGIAQRTPRTRFSRTSEDLRGASVVSSKIAWASGTHGTYVRNSDGRIWIPEQVPGAEALDFRGIVAFSADEAFLMSAGPGEQSRIYHTADAGRHWQVQFTNTNPKGFFDSMVFWDRTHGLVLGDPIPDEAGNLKFELLMTEDGKTWAQIPPAQLPPALDGEGAFAASNSCLAIFPLTGATTKSPKDDDSATSKSGAPASWKGGALASWKSDASAPRKAAESEGASAPESLDPNIWFATGGKAARVFHSPDRGRTWQVFDTPIAHGTDSEGIFSIAFRDPSHGVIAGGDYKHPDQDGPNLAFTSDGGATWTLSKIFPQSYYSAVAYDRSFKAPDSKRTDENQANVRIFLVGPKFVYDFRPPQNPTRISPGKKAGWLRFNAISPYPNGGALVVGPKGSIAVIP